MFQKAGGPSTDISLRIGPPFASLVGARPWGGRQLGPGRLQPVDAFVGNREAEARWQGEGVPREGPEETKGHDDLTERGQVS